MEEDIKILKEIIKYFSKYELVLNKKYSQAIEHLIKRNKELMEIIDLYKNASNNGASIIQETINKDYIPKSKVIEKIEELRNEKYDDITFKYNRIEVNGIIEVVLEELLEDKEK